LISSAATEDQAILDAFARITRHYPFASNLVQGCPIYTCHPSTPAYSINMNVKDAIITEIKAAPESLLREAYDFILRLKRQKSSEMKGEQSKMNSPKPDFLARQKALFGSRKLANSQSTLDQLRADRF
jgi:hypothetical protein